MPRHPRDKGQFCIYHIILRGNERKNIFYHSEEKKRFLTTLARMKTKYNFIIYSYCLMDNHVHLVINDNGNDISKIMKSITVSFAYYYNNRHKRCGHLFQDRFKSELIDNDSYLLQVSKYIHNNPVKAGMVSKPGEYRWSSYNIFVGNQGDLDSLMETELILGIISNARVKAVKEYIKYVNEKEDDILVMDVEDDNIDCGVANSDYIDTIGQAIRKMEEIAAESGITVDDLINKIKLRDSAIREIRKNSSLTLKQIGELFGGISESRVSRILRS